jgi:hypothetical protein
VQPNPPEKMHFACMCGSLYKTGAGERSNPWPGLGFLFQTERQLLICILRRIPLAYRRAHARTHAHTHIHTHTHTCACTHTKIYPLARAIDLPQVRGNNSDLAGSHPVTALAPTSFRRIEIKGFIWTINFDLLASVGKPVVAPAPGIGLHSLVPLANFDTSPIYSYGTCFFKRDKPRLLTVGSPSPHPLSDYCSKLLATHFRVALFCNRYRRLRALELNINKRCITVDRLDQGSRSHIADFK